MQKFVFEVKLYFGFSLGIRIKHRLANKIKKKLNKSHVHIEWQNKNQCWNEQRSTSKMTGWGRAEAKVDPNCLKTF